MQYRHTVVAGTFDHFHAGHRALLDLALSSGDQVTIGITDHSMHQEKLLGDRIQPYEEREATVKAYAAQQKSDRVTCIRITDIFGNVLTDATVDSIVGTDATMRSIEVLQRERAKRGMPELTVLIVPLIAGEDGEPISSTRIRLGIINAEGTSYLLPFRNKGHFTAPSLVKDELRVPVGDVYTGPEDAIHIAARPVLDRIEHEQPTMVISVGDIVTQSLQQADIEPDISFVDYRSRRSDRKDLVHSAVHRFGPFKNEAGTINSAVALTFADIIVQSIQTKEHMQIVIEGEEDLFGLVTILLSPLGAVMIYGQFDQGMVYVPIDEERKAQALLMLQRFL